MLSQKKLVSSAPARPETKRAILKLFPNGRLFELYGSTEAGWVTVLRPDEQIARLGSVGREWAGSGAIKLLDAEGRYVEARFKGQDGRTLVQAVGRVHLHRVELDLADHVLGLLHEAGLRGSGSGGRAGGRERRGDARRGQRR